MIKYRLQMVSAWAALKHSCNSQSQQCLVPHIIAVCEATLLHYAQIQKGLRLYLQSPAKNDRLFLPCFLACFTFKSSQQRLLSTKRVQHTGSLSGRTAHKTETQTAAAPQDFQLSEGKGWKMGFDRRPHNPGSFSALLGGDDWSMALSKYEYDDFVKVRCPDPCITKHVSGTMDVAVS